MNKKLYLFIPRKENNETNGIFETLSNYATY